MRRRARALSPGIRPVTRLGSALALVLALAAAAPAFAQTPLDPLDDHSAKRLDRMEQVLREMRAIVFQGRETGKPIVVEPADTDSQLAALTSKINDLEQALTRINGQLEVTSHALDQAQQEADSMREETGALKDHVAELEQKLNQIEGPAPPAAAAAPGSGGAAAAPAVAPGPAGPDDPAAAFVAARQAYGAKDYATAEAGFRDYITRYAGGPREPEAQYYLGKILLSRQDYGDAAAAEVAAIRQWPQTTWAPDAVLDLSRALIAMKQPTDACQTLGELQRRYPKVSAEVRAGAADARAQAQCS
jgi:tol-pal system protein YbgF